MTSPVPSPPASTTSTSTTPFLSMTFNPATSLFNTGNGSKSLIPLSTTGPLTPKSHEQQANVIRPIPHRSRFFHAETPRPAAAFKPWFDDDKENYIPKTMDTKTVSGCLRCFDKATFVLEPCSHLYTFPNPIPSSLPLKMLNSLIQTLRQMHDKLCQHD
jgi:hypothetical protein